MKCNKDDEDNAQGCHTTFIYTYQTVIPSRTHGAFATHIQSNIYYKYIRPLSGISLDKRFIRMSQASVSSIPRVVPMFNKYI